MKLQISIRAPTFIHWVNILPAHHPDSLHTMNSLAKELRKQGREEEARQVEQDYNEFAKPVRPAEVVE